ncbi:MAG: serine hydrolase [Comamonadaceae bacterium PBBC2]|nr:MAG: serine hydrolase [Comamonadaceae bacterium PBBC2]
MKFPQAVRALLALLLCTLSCTLPAQGLDAALQAIQTNPKAPLSSLSVLAIYDGKPVYVAHFGHRRMGATAPDPSTATDSKTLYRMASVSKLVTTLGAMRLVDAGRLDLDADVGKYLGFKVRNPSFPEVPITTRMLLSHTASLRDGAGYVFGLDVALQDVLSPQGKQFGAGAAWAARSATADLSPGRYFQYSNLSFGVVGTVLEAITGERFDVYMQRTVLQPLGVRGAYTPEGLQQDDVDHLAALYRKGQDGAWNSAGPWVAQTDDWQGKLPPARAGLAAYVPGTNATGFGPQGGLRISVAGLGVMVQMLLNDGVLNVPASWKKQAHAPVRFLSAAAVAALQHTEWRYTPESPNGDTLGGQVYAWGLGMQRFTDTREAGPDGKARGDRLVAEGGVSGWGHAGLAYGLQSLFFYDPVKRIGLVYALGGSGVDPALHPGQFSGFKQWEEQIMAAVYQYANANAKTPP